MLSQQLSELRLTDPICIVLFAVLLGAFIGGSIMFMQDRRKARKDAKCRPVLKPEPKGRYRITRAEFNAFKAHVEDSTKRFFSEKEIDQLRADILKNGEKLNGTRP